MMIREAMNVFWQTLKDTWEELYNLAIVNLVWLFCFVPVTVITVTQSPYIVLPAFLLALILVPSATVGVYYCTYRVAQGKTFHFADFLDGVKIYWWRSLIWLVVNAVVIFLIRTNLLFYPTIIQGPLIVLVGGLWLAVFVFWVSMQLYFWPMLMRQEQTKMLLAWRNSAYLLLANPFFAFFIVSFTLVLLAASLALTLPFIFVGMSLLSLLGNNAVVTMLVKLKIIQDPRVIPPVAR